ncbi:MAG TPA: hypothetical protein VMF11_15090 [Candidatus Baltobacteraceae bacterium]|nr:hypothetical protein [Candidatus Baltobacteraceae bacterium]
MDTSERPALRALTIGEIFDRAVTFYVRNFVVFTLTVLTLLAPAGLAEYFYTTRSSAELTQILSQLQHPGGTPYFPPQFGTLILVALFVLLLAPFCNNAVAVGVATIYSGHTPSYAGGFRRVLRRWAALFGTTVLCGLILLGIYFALAITLTIVLFGSVAATGRVPLFSIPTLVVFVVVVLVAALFFATVFIVCVFALYATTIEDDRPGEAIGEGFERIFNRREYPKALLMALCYVVLQIGALLISFSLALLIVSVLHSDVLQMIVSTLINAMLTAFGTVLMAVYYYDVRTRAEGLDLEDDLQRLTAPT